MVDLKATTVYSNPSASPGSGANKSPVWETRGAKASNVTARSERSVFPSPPGRCQGNSE